MFRRVHKNRNAGGGALGNIRIMIAADYSLTGNIQAGVRLGLILNTYPGAAAGEERRVADLAVGWGWVVRGEGVQKTL